jgi:hypothetical protein
MYDGDMAVALPELDENEKPAAVNLLGPGLDQLAMRVASVLPDQSWPSLRDGIQKSTDLARSRRKANLAWWDMNDMKLNLRLRARHLLGYGTSAVTLSPVSNSPFDKRQIPHWHVRDPLDVFAAPTSDPLDFEPLYGIVVHHQTLAWLNLMYPDQYRSLRKGKFKDNPTARFDIIEYHDHEQAGTLIVVGDTDSQPTRWQPGLGNNGGSPDGSQPYAVLGEVVINRAEIPLIVFPGRITLGEPRGAFDSLIGKYQRASKLDALQTIAVQRAIFPEEWVVSHPNAPGTAKIITHANGRTGQRGVIANGVIQTIAPQPNQMADQSIDRLERTERVEAGIPAELNGESGSNIRTARRGAQVLGSNVDMPVQEAQEILEVSLEAENLRAVAIQKSYYGKKMTSFYVGRDGQTLKGADTYTPNDIFETDVHFVKYSLPGADMNGMIIGLGQRVGLGTLSTETFMEMDPVVEDVQMERSRVAQDGIRKALLASVEQGAAQGQMPANVIAMILKKMQNPDTLVEDAINQVHEEMAAQQQAAQEAQQQGQPPGPESQPGISAPPPGAPGTPPGAGPGPGMPVSPGPPSSQNLQNILGALKQPAPAGAQ